MVVVVTVVAVVVVVVVVVCKFGLNQEVLCAMPSKIPPKKDHRDHVLCNEKVARLFIIDKRTKRNRVITLKLLHPIWVLLLMMQLIVVIFLELPCNILMTSSRPVLQQTKSLFTLVSCIEQAKTIKYLGQDREEIFGHANELSESKIKEEQFPGE